MAQASVRMTFTSPTGANTSYFTATGANTVEFDLSGTNSVAQSTTKTITVAIPFANIEAFMFQSDQAVTVKINAGPDETYSIVAGQGLYWVNGEYNALPITHDITEIQVQNAGTNAANVSLKFLVTA